MFNKLNESTTKAWIFLTELKNDEKGVTAIEYGVIALAMAALLTTVFASSGGVISALTDGFGKLSTAITKFNSSI